MKFLILNTDYASFLQTFYNENPGLENESYERQLQARTDTLFGVSDFYSRNLRKLGHEAWDIHANNFHLQTAWMRSHVNRSVSSPKNTNTSTTIGTLRKLARKTPLRYAKRIFQPLLKTIDEREQAWFYEILAKQIKYYRPDVLYNQDILAISGTFLRQMKPFIKLLVVQHPAISLSKKSDYGCYDLAISSFPPTVQFFREKGIPSHLVGMAFEPTILSEVSLKPKTYDLTFVGNLFSGVHDSRRNLIEFLSNKFEQLKIWGPTVEHLAEFSPIRKHYAGAAWGRQLYEILSASKITINHHGDIPPYANNMRLYEATGVGSMLITDWKENLHEMFEPDREVVTYRDFSECAEKIQHYLDHPSERDKISKAGQEKTLSHHTYYQRMQQLVEILLEETRQKHLKLRD